MAIVFSQAQLKERKQQLNLLFGNALDNAQDARFDPHNRRLGNFFDKVAVLAEKLRKSPPKQKELREQNNEFLGELLFAAKYTFNREFFNEIIDLHPIVIENYAARTGKNPATVAATWFLDRDACRYGATMDSIPPRSRAWIFDGLTDEQVPRVIRNMGVGGIAALVESLDFEQKKRLDMCMSEAYKKAPKDDWQTREAIRDGVRTIRVFATQSNEEIKIA